MVGEHLLCASTLVASSHLTLQLLCEADIAITPISHMWKRRLREFILSDLP